MKKLFFFLGIILLVAVANAGPPTDNPVFFEIEMVTDVIEVEQVDFISTQFSTLDREVSFHLPYSNSVSSNSGFVKSFANVKSGFIEKHEPLLTGDLELISILPPIQYRNLNEILLSFTLPCNQHSNYGYPLSADPEYGNL